MVGVFRLFSYVDGNNYASVFWLYMLLLCGVSDLCVSLIVYRWLVLMC